MYLPKNPNAMHIIETYLKNNNLDVSGWYSLCENPNAIDIIKNNLDKTITSRLARNSNIFTLDYDRMKEKMKNTGFAEELVKKVYDPKRLLRISNSYSMEFDLLMEVLF